MFRTKSTYSAQTRAVLREEKKVLSKFNTYTVKINLVNITVPFVTLIAGNSE